MLESKENAIEFLYGDKEATVTFCSPRYVSKIKKLSKDRPEECKIIAENEDGSVVAHVPIRWVKISPPRKMDMTEEKKEELRERMKKMQEAREKKRTEDK